MAFFDEKTGGLITQWKTVSAITDIVGSDTSAKIWPQKIPQGQAAPCVVFTRMDGMPYISLGGTTGARHTLLHVFCYGSTFSQAVSLAEAIKTNTEAMRGSYSGTVVNRVQTLGIFDETEQITPGSDERRYFIRLVISIVHGE